MAQGGSGRAGQGVVRGAECHENPARAAIPWNEPAFRFPRLSQRG